MSGSVAELPATTVTAAAAPRTAPRQPAPTRTPPTAPDNRESVAGGIQFGRVCRLIVGRGGQSGTEIVGLRTAFQITKTSAKNPNNSTIRVWNLSRATRALLERPDTRCVLYAGYEQAQGALKMFEGEVVFAWTKNEKADAVTEFQLGEGVVATRDGMTSRSYGRGATTRTMLENLAADMELTLVAPADLPQRSYPAGLSLHGATRVGLDKVTRAAGLAWSIQGGALQVVLAGGRTSRRAIVLAADTGMVEGPERVRQGQQQASRVRDETTGQQRRAASATQGYDGWRVTSLLLPTLLPNDPVVLEGRNVQGTYVVRELTHTGDTHSGTWQTECLLVDDATAARLRTQDAAQGGRGRAAPSTATPPVPPATPRP